MLLSSEEPKPENEATQKKLDQNKRKQNKKRIIFYDLLGEYALHVRVATKQNENWTEQSLPTVSFISISD